MAFGPKVTVTLERYTETLTSTNSPSFVWRPVRTLRGTLQTVRGDRGPLFNRMAITADYQFMLDKPAGLTITEKDRLRYGTRYFTVKLSEDPMGRQRYTILYLESEKREQAES